MDDFADLIAISRFAGERFDLVQAGGGNTSQRFDDGRLYVKASGMALGAVAGIDDFCCVSWPPLLDFLDQANTNSDTAVLEAKANKVVSAAMQSNARRPSIETLLHCALGTFTLHTHPIAVSAVVCRSDWKERLIALFPDAFFVDYKTPGPALAVELRQELLKRNWQPGTAACIFLQNHGLIVAGKSKEVVIQMTNDIVERLAVTLPIDLSKYKLVNFTSRLVNKICAAQWVSYLSEDQKLIQCAGKSPAPFLTTPLMPDQLVYCGPTGLVLEDQDEGAACQAITAYWKTYSQPPRVVVVKEGTEHHILTLGQNLQKCKDTEAVLKSLILLLEGAGPCQMQFLTSSEVDYLSNWEAEKYRQRL